MNARLTCGNGLSDERRRSFCKGDKAMSSVAPIFLPDEFNAASYFIDRHIQEARADKVAIECGEVHVTYRQLFERVNQVGNGLRTLGVRIEERVFLLLLDSPEFATSFFGAIKIGAVPVPVNTLLKSADYEYLLNNSRARAAIVSESLVAAIEAIPRQQLRYLETGMGVGEESRTGTLSFEKLARDSSSVLRAESTGKDDVAFWLYSSGSTGQPKACVHLQHDMVVSSERYAKSILNITEKDRCFSVAKLFFAYGLGNALYFPLAVVEVVVLNCWVTETKETPFASSVSTILAKSDKLRVRRSTLYTTTTLTLLAWTSSSSCFNPGRSMVPPEYPPSS